MKKYTLTLLALLALTPRLYAQDDVYFVPSRKAIQNEESLRIRNSTYEELPADGNGQVYDRWADQRNIEGRNVDEYNRRYRRPYSASDSLSYDCADEETATSRLVRFRSPRLSLVASPYYYDYYYDLALYDPWFSDWGWSTWHGWYDPFYNPWRYSWAGPYSWSWDWNSWGWTGWGWNSWAWSMPYYGYYSPWYTGWGGFWGRNHYPINNYAARSGEFVNGNYYSNPRYNSVASSAARSVSRVGGFSGSSSVRSGGYNASRSNGFSMRNARTYEGASRSSFSNNSYSGSARSSNGSSRSGGSVTTRSYSNDSQPLRSNSVQGSGFSGGSSRSGSFSGGGFSGGGSRSGSFSGGGGFSGGSSRSGGGSRR